MAEPGGIHGRRDRDRDQDKREGDKPTCYAGAPPGEGGGVLAGLAARFDLIIPGLWGSVGRRHDSGF